MNNSEHQMFLYCTLCVETRTAITHGTSCASLLYLQSYIK